MIEETAASAFTFVEDVRAVSPIPESGLGHATVLVHSDLRVVVLTFASGHVLKEHSAPFPIIMQSLNGDMLVRTPRKEIRLTPGAILRLDAALPHEVEALGESRLMLTLVTKK